MDTLKDERFDFTILENDIVRDTDKYDKNELLAYIAISYHANKQGTCFPSYEGIARIMRTSRSTAINAIQGLVEKGVIKLENRKSDEKKNNKLTSNLYTLVSNKFWEQAERENKIYLAKKNADYKKRYVKGQATKIANKNAQLIQEEQEDKKNTPDSTAIETDVLKSCSNNSNKSSDKSIIPQKDNDCTEETFDKNGQNMSNDQNMSNELKERLELLTDAGIKYVPYKTEALLIESLEIDILKQAIDVTLEQSTSNSWRYLLPTYDSICVKRSIEKQSQSKPEKNTFKPRYKGGISMVNGKFGGKSFDEWDDEEFDRECQRMQ